jgi:hypothetical protein
MRRLSLSAVSKADRVAEDVGWWARQKMKDHAAKASGVEEDAGWWARQE